MTGTETTNDFDEQPIHARPPTPVLIKPSKVLPSQAIASPHLKSGGPVRPSSATRSVRQESSTGSSRPTSARGEPKKDRASPPPKRNVAVIKGIVIVGEFFFYERNKAPCVMKI